MLFTRQYNTKGYDHLMNFVKFFVVNSSAHRCQPLLPHYLVWLLGSCANHSLLFIVQNISHRRDLTKEWCGPVTQSCNLCQRRQSNRRFKPLDHAAPLKDFLWYFYVEIFLFFSENFKACHCFSSESLRQLFNFCFLLKSLRQSSNFYWLYRLGCSVLKSIFIWHLFKTWDLFSNHWMTE